MEETKGRDFGAILLDEIKVMVSFSSTSFEISST